MNRTLEVLQSFAVSGARLGIGTFTHGYAKKPEKPIELYEFEACPFCRKVREALTDLDLDAMIYPCPKEGTRFRPRVKELGGKTQFPFLVDPNTNTRLYESADIIRYLYATYGGRKPPLLMQVDPVSNALSFMASGIRPGRGLRASPSRSPGKPLELYSFESSPFARLVRERLCELELPYLLHNVGKGRQNEWVPPVMRRKFGIEIAPSTENRKAFMARSGQMQVPYLVDPNTGIEMFESRDILAYLDRTYAV